MAAAHIEQINSLQNSLVKSVRKAIARGSHTEDGLVLAEGFHLLEEAGRSAEVEIIIATASAMSKASKVAKRLVEVPDWLFQEIAGTEAPQGILSLVRLPTWDPATVWGPNALVLVLDGVQDPGNAGTMLRAAEAFGATGVLALKGTVDLANPKVVRASAGSLFRIATLRGTPEDIQAPAFASAGDAAAPAHTVDWRGPCAIIVGSEGHGVSAPLRKIAKGVRIPTQGVESLNAGVAAAVLLYEVSRQRGV